MKEIKNPDFSPKIPKFTCDDENNKIPQPFPRSHFNMTLIGRPGSGKSSLATCIIAGKHRGHSVYRKLVIYTGFQNSFKNYSCSTFSKRCLIVKAVET